jgi:lipid-binding SYLF domain-containing protein
MKKLLVGCAVWLVASSGLAALKHEEVKRFQESARIIDELRGTPDKGIPDELWKKARCVVVIPSLKKAAFVFGGEYGAGVMTCRHATGWSAPVFMQLAKGSWGLQIGAEEIDLALLVMNQRGADRLLEDKVSLGADASVAAGPVGRTADAATDAKITAEMLAYSRSHGIFAGIDLSGGVLKPDTESNERTYGAKVRPRRIADGTERVTVPPEAQAFLESVSRERREASE